jgi:hypothetical protein
MRQMVEQGIEGLRESLAGTVLGPGDAGYEAARRCFNALVDRRPAAIVRCLRPADVASAFDFARTHDLDVAVRGGGHNPAGHCVVDDGLVIDMSAMHTVDVDAEARVARAPGGSTWLDFDSATQELGLVTPGGVVGSTGVCGSSSACIRSIRSSAAASEPGVKDLGTRSAAFVTWPLVLPASSASRRRST